MPSVQPSCPAGPNSLEVICIMCHEKFEQFFDDDSEQWLLRNAERIGDTPVHPMCAKDLMNN